MTRKNVATGILISAMDSVTGIIRYHGHEYEVVPLSTGTTRRGNEVLYAETYDTGETWMFIIDQIEDFRPQKRPVTPAFPIRLDMLKRRFIRYADQQALEDLYGESIYRDRHARIERIANLIMEFSGSEANQFVNGKTPDSYNPVGHDGRDGEPIIAELTDKQKAQVDKFTERRREGLEFGAFDYDGDGRYFVKLSGSNAKVVEPPQEIKDIVDRAGYWMPDYRQGKLYRKDDKEMLQNNAPKFLTVLKKELHGNEEEYKRIKKMFDERESGSSKRLENVKMMLCITCNPYDIAGMSTDRSWTSCMALPTGEDDNYGGAYHTTALKQVQYGGIVAYLIRDDDRSIQMPFARIAVKRLENDYGGYIYKMETRLYGDQWIANESGFKEALKRELDKSNAKTSQGNRGVFKRNDKSYSDGSLDMEYGELSREDYEKMDYSELARLVKSGKLRLTEDDVRDIIELKRMNGQRPSLMFMNAVLPNMSEKFIDDYFDYIDVDEYERRMGMAPGEGGEYIGDDSPESLKDFSYYVEEKLNDYKRTDDFSDAYADDYDDDGQTRVTYGASISPEEVLSYGMRFPTTVMNTVETQIDSFLRQYYSANVDQIQDRYDSVGEFDNAYWSNDLDDDDMASVSDFILENDYDERLDVNLDVIIHETEDEGVYRLTGTIGYSMGFSDLDFHDYENEATIDVNTAAWKDRTDMFLRDLMNEFPV